MPVMMRTEFQRQGLHSNTTEHSRDHLIVSETLNRELKETFEELKRVLKYRRNKCPNN